MTSEDEGVAAIAAACRAAKKAESAVSAAIRRRESVAIEVWPDLARLGYKRVIDAIGDGLLSASNLRRMTRSLEHRPPRGPAVGPGPDAKEKAAIKRLAAASRAIVDARKAHGHALNERSRVIRHHWPAVKYLGVAELARRVGSQHVGESTISHAVAELKRLDEE